MATTTAAAIRDRIRTVIQALTPQAHRAQKFIAYRNEGGANFRRWAQQEQAGAYRRFQVRDTGDDSPPSVSNTDVEERLVTFRVTIAYPHTSRTGKDGALDRDDIMALDQHQIEHAIGMCGRASFTAPTYPDACWRSGRTRREIGDICDFLIVEQSMSFFRVMT